MRTALVVVLVAGGCAGRPASLRADLTSDQPDPLDATALPSVLIVAPPTAKVTLRATQQFTATANYGNGTSADLTAQVNWTVGDPAVANVEKGLATGSRRGATSVMARLGDIVGVGVLQVRYEGKLDILPAGTSLPVGQSQQFKALAVLADGSTEDVTAQAAWASSDTSVMIISAGGLATAVNKGTAAVQVTLDAAAGQTALTVVDAICVKFEVTPQMAGASTGLQRKFSAVCTLGDGTTIDVSSLATWTSASPAVATVDGTGLATAYQYGLANITATYGVWSSVATLNVHSGCGIAYQMEITPTSALMSKGGKLQLTATLWFDGVPLDATTVSMWSSGDVSVATVSSKGIATAISTGTTSITAAWCAASNANPVTLTVQ